VRVAHHRGLVGESVVAQSLKVEVVPWHGQDEEGWGHPRVALEEVGESMGLMLDVYLPVDLATT